MCDPWNVQKRKLGVHKYPDLKTKILLPKSLYAHQFWPNKGNVKQIGPFQRSTIRDVVNIPCIITVLFIHTNYLIIFFDHITFFLKKNWELILSK